MDNVNKINNVSTIINQMSAEQKDKYYKGSQIFVGLAKKGDIKSLVEHVYHQADPYIQHVPSRSSLAKNALSFFVMNNHVEAFEQFFTTPFIEDIEKEDMLFVIDIINNYNNKQMVKIVQRHYNQNLSIPDLYSILLSACSNGTKDMIYDMVDKLKVLKKELNPAEKMDCCLSVLNSSSYPNATALETFKLLETLFPDVLYHQQDDILMRTALEKKQLELVNYLMYEKKLRITKHLNMLSYTDLDFAKIVGKRKIYDSMAQKMRNKHSKENRAPEIKSKKLKI